MRPCFANDVMRVVAAAGVLTLLGCAALAQSQEGVLIGSVSGPNNEIVAGVLVHLSLQGEAQSPVPDTTTDESGQFKFVGLPAGLYTVAVSATGWHRRSVKDLEVRAASTLDVGIVISPDVSRNNSVSNIPAPSLAASDGGVWWGDRLGDLSIRELPTARRIWSLLETQETSTVTDRLDTGGLETGRRPLFGALGASWTENQYSLNSFDVTDPYIPGRPLADPDYDSLAAVTVVAGAKPASFAGSGANLLLTTVQPPMNLHGGARLFFSNHSLQSDNMDSRLAGF